MHIGIKDLERNGRMDIGLKWIEREEFVILGKEIMQALRQNEGNVLEYKE